MKPRVFMEQTVLESLCKTETMGETGTFFQHASQ